MEDDGTRDLERVTDAAGQLFWYHSIDLGGFVTPGEKTQATLDEEWRALGVPDLRDRSVLDIGAWDGYFSFRAEREGAARVVALDHYAWSTRLREQQAYYRRSLETDEPYAAPHLVPSLWDPVALPGRAAFDLARERLGSQVEAVVADFERDDLSGIGTFDVVFFVGVLYHLEDPMSALRRVAALADEVAIVRTVAMEVPGVSTPLWEFYPTTELAGDASNWWAPNCCALEGALRACGFRTCIVRSPVPAPSSELQRYLLTMQAWKT